MTRCNVGGKGWARGLSNPFHHTRQVVFASIHWLTVVYLCLGLECVRDFCLSSGTLKLLVPMKEKCRKEDEVLFVPHQDSLSFSLALISLVSTRSGSEENSSQWVQSQLVSEGLRNASPHLVFKNLLILYLLASNPLWWWRLFLLCSTRVHYSTHLPSQRLFSLVFSSSGCLANSFLMGSSKVMNL